MKEYKDIINVAAENPDFEESAEKQNMVVEVCTMIILAVSLIVLFCLL